MGCIGIEEIDQGGRRVQGAWIGKELKRQHMQKEKDCTLSESRKEIQRVSVLHTLTSSPGVAGTGRPVNAISHLMK